MKQKVNKNIVIYTAIGSVCFIAAVLLTIILGAGIFHQSLSLPEELSDSVDIEERCPNPPDGPFVFWDYRVRTESLVQIQYTCVEGFFFDENEVTVSTCLQDGRWSSIFAPECIPDCGLPPAIPNTKKISESTVRTKNGSSIITAASYDCENAILVSRVNYKEDINIKCLLNNQWEEPQFRCVGSSCPQPPQRDHVSWFYVNIKSDDITIDITTSNKIRYKCDKGYHFSVNESIVSECFNGNWDINVAPLCLPDCGSVPDIPNASTQGRIERNPVKDREPVATAAFYSCEKETIYIGPTTTGDNRLKCLDDTNWEEPNFSCVKECPNPVFLSEVVSITVLSKVKDDNLYSGAKILYAYRQGKETKLSDTNDLVTCLDSGLWDKTFVYKSTDLVHDEVVGGECGMLTKKRTVDDDKAYLVLDKDITASSWRFSDSEGYKDSFKPSNARLFSIEGEGSWTAADNDNEKTLEVDFRQPFTLTGVVTQGSAGGSKWPKYVTSFQILYRPEGSSKFDFVSDEGEPVLFSGNFDGDTPVVNEFPETIRAQVIKIKVITWQDLPSLRVDFLTC